MESLNAFVKNYAAYLEYVNGCKGSESIANRLASCATLDNVAFLKEVLEIVGLLSIKIQKRDFCFFKADSEVKTAIKLLENIRDEGILDQSFEAAIKRRNLNGIGLDYQKKDFIDKHKFLNNLIDNMNSRCFAFISTKANK